MKTIIFIAIIGMILMVLLTGCSGNEVEEDLKKCVMTLSESVNNTQICIEELDTCKDTVKAMITINKNQVCVDE